MMFDIKNMFGIIAGFLSLSAYLLYIFTTIKGETHPSRVTWWILTLVGSLILASYYREGARESIWIAASHVIGPFMIALLSITYGERTDKSKIGLNMIGKWCLYISLGSLSVWGLFSFSGFKDYLLSFS